MNRQVHELWCTAPPLNHSTNKLSYLKHTTPQGEQRQRLPRPCTILPSEQRQRLRAPPRQNLPFTQLQPPPHTAILNSRVLP